MFLLPRSNVMTSLSSINHTQWPTKFMCVGATTTLNTKAFTKKPNNLAPVWLRGTAVSRRARLRTMNLSFKEANHEQHTNQWIEGLLIQRSPCRVYKIIYLLLRNWLNVFLWIHFSLNVTRHARSSYLPKPITRDSLNKLFCGLGIYLRKIEEKNQRKSHIDYLVSFII